MSVATTPSQIKKECSGVPTCGTVVIIVTPHSKTTFIVAMGQDRLIRLLRQTIVDHKTWLGAIMSEIVVVTPTCPLPKNPIKELNQFVVMTTASHLIESTADNWDTQCTARYSPLKKCWSYSGKVAARSGAGA